MGNSSSSSNASLSIALEKVQFRAGEAVRGYVQVHVTAPIACKDVYAKLEGEVRTHVTFESTNTERDADGESHDTTEQNTTYQRRSIVSENICVATFPGEAAPGFYQFPFQFMLHPNLPSSTYLPDVHGDGACLAYGVSVQLERPGFLKFDLVSRAMLEVNAAIPRTIKPVRAVAVKEVELCCMCCPRGEIRLQGSLSHNAFSGNEAVLVKVSLKNRSSEAIQFIAVELKESISFSANSHSSTRENVLAATELPGLAAGGTLEDASVQLKLPPSFANSSVRTSLLTIQHTVKVIAVTGCCVTDPALNLPVTLFRAPEVVAFGKLPRKHKGEADPYAKPVPYHPDTQALGSPIQVEATVVDPTAPHLEEASAPPQQVFAAMEVQAVPMSTPLVQ